MTYITDLPQANSIDPVQDMLAIVTNSLNATQKINRNTYLGLSSAPVGLTDSQTLTNKTLTSPTINGATLSGTLSGTYTLGGSPTFPSNVVTTTGSQTLTNKNISSAVINTPVITNATISSDAYVGFSSSNSGSIYGMSVSSGVLNSAALANAVNTAAIQAGAIGSSQIATNGVAASNLATSAITLGYAQITSNLTTSSTSAVQATGLTVTVTIPSGGRRIRITAYSTSFTNSGSNVNILTLWDGTVGSGTQIGQGNNGGSTSANSVGLVSAIVTPSPGSKTYNVGIQVTAGTLTLGATANAPAYILVEAI